MRDNEPTKEISNITIGFSTSYTIISKIIRWFTKSRVSHTYIAFDDSNLEKRIIMEANLYGYKLMQYECWIRKNKVVAEFVCKEDLTKSLKYMAKELGKDYDFWSALGLVVRRWVSKRYKNPFRNSRKMHCSEAITLFLQRTELALELDPKSTTPEDLLQYCLQNNNFEEVDVFNSK
jgi:hypothetical protein